MSKSTAILVGIVATLVYTGAVFYFGGVYKESTFINTPVVVHETVNMDSLKNVWLRGKLDSTTYRALWLDYTALKDRKPTIRWKHDTTYVDSSQSLPFYSTDTSLPVMVGVTTMDEEDTVNQKVPTTVHMSLDFFPDLEMFRLRNLSADPIGATFTRKRSLIEERNDGLSFVVEPTLGWGRLGISGGGYLGVNDWSIGALVITNEQPQWLIKWRHELFTIR